MDTRERPLASMGVLAASYEGNLHSALVKLRYTQGRKGEFCSGAYKSIVRSTTMLIQQNILIIQLETQAKMKPAENC